MTDLLASFLGVGVLPQVTSAFATSPMAVRVFFSEPMLNNAALSTPANYIFTPHFGAAARTAIAVLPLGTFPQAVDITLDGALTAGVANYTVTVSNVADAASNGIDVAHNFADFDGLGTPSIIATPDHVQKDGGYTVALSGTSLPTGVYLVHIGPLGAQGDPACYSGVEGSGSRVTFANNRASVVIPPLPVGGPYAFLLEKITGTGPQTFLSSPALTVTPQDFKSRTLLLRRFFPSWLKLGIRTTRVAPFPQ